MPTKWVVYAQIKREVSIQQVLEHYNLFQTLKKRGKDHVGPCPIHNGSNPTEFKVSLEKNVYNCFGACQEGGNVIDLVAELEEVHIREAALRMARWFNVNSLPPKGCSRKSRKARGAEPNRHRRAPGSH